MTRPTTVILLALCGALCAFAKCHAGERKVLRVQTAHYDLECDAGASFTRELAKHMEAIYAEYYRRLRDYGGKIKKRFKVRAFDSREDYLRLVGPAYANSGGIYMPRSMTLASFGDRAFGARHPRCGNESLPIDR